VLAPPQTTTLFGWAWWLVELTSKVPQRLLGTYIGVLHSSNLCACSSTNYRTVWMGVVVSGTHFKSTTEIAGDLHRGTAQLYPLCLLLHKLPHCFDGRGG